MLQIATFQKGFFAQLTFDDEEFSLVFGHKD